MERNLSIRITGRDDAAPALRAAKAEVQALNAAAIEGDFQIVHAQTQVAAATTKVTGALAQKTVAVRRSIVGIGTLRDSFASLASTAAGVPGPLGTVAAVVLSMGAGSLATAGVFAGLAGVVWGIRQIGKAAREERESVEKFLDMDPLGRRKGIENVEGLQAARSERAAAAASLAGTRPTTQRLLNLGETTELIEIVNPAFKKLQDRITELDAGINDFVLNLRNEQTAEVAGIMQDRKEAAARQAAADKKDAEDAARRAGMISAALGTSIDRAGKVHWGRAARERARLLEANPFLEMGELTAQTKAPDMELLAQGIKKGGGQIVSALSLAANAIAGLVTGNQSALGSLGGAASGFSALASGAGKGSALFGLSTPLGIAGIAFGFLDALTSNRHKETQAEAHLEALRRHDAERPPATIILNIDPFDPKNRDHQRVVDAARREANASGYRVSVAG